MIFDHADTLRATYAHPLFSLDKNAWHPAGELEAGESVLSKQGKALLTGKKPLPGNLTVYNLEVGRLHNFLVGKSGIAAHNSCLVEELVNVLRVSYKKISEERFTRLHDYLSLRPIEKTLANMPDWKFNRFVEELRGKGGVGPGEIRAELAGDWEVLFNFPTLSTNTGALNAVTKHRAGEVVPLPQTYLDAGYISNHLAKFDNGGSFLVPTEVLDQYGRNLVGRPDGQFISPADEIDDLLAAANGNISVIEDALGIPSGAWQGKQLSRIDIPNTSSHNRRLPSGNETGANEHWIPGGVTSGKMSEAVVDQIPIGSYSETVIN